MPGAQYANGNGNSAGPSNYGGAGYGAPPYGYNGYNPYQYAYAPPPPPMPHSPRTGPARGPGPGPGPGGPGPGPAYGMYAYNPYQPPPPHQPPHKFAPPMQPMPPPFYAPPPPFHPHQHPHAHQHQHPHAPHAPPQNWQQLQLQQQNHAPISPLPKTLAAALPPPPALTPEADGPATPSLFAGPPAPPAPEPAPPPDDPPVEGEEDVDAGPRTGTAEHESSLSFAIWSRRPSDPARAPGVIIAPRARPPPNVRAQALEERTPPASPAPVPVRAHHGGPPAGLKTPEGVGMLIGEEKKVEEPEPEVEVEEQPDVAVVVAETSPLLPSASAPVPDPAPVPLPDTSPEAPPEPATESAPAEPAAPAPAPAPSAPKSWASLFSSGTASKLPASTVVGFSVPASPPPARVPPSQREPLLRLLAGSTLPAPSPPARAGPAGQPPVIRARGLVNTGNMCFANAVLQLLAYVGPFARLLEAVGLAVGDSKPGRGGEGATPLVDATVRFLREFAPEERRRGEDEEDDGLDSFLPSYVYEAMKEKKRFESMLGQHQEDAEEFFGFFLDTLEEELAALASSLGPANSTSTAPAPAPAPVDDEPAEDPSAGWTAVGKRNRLTTTRTARARANGGSAGALAGIFGGKFRSTLHVPGQRDRAVLEDWRALQLDISRESVHSIEDALHALCAPTPVQLGSAGEKGTQRVLVDSLPPVLVLHLKRFHYDVATHTPLKLGRRIAYGPHLEIPAELLARPAPRAERRFRLVGVVYHHGASAAGGHYTLDVLHPNRDGVRGVAPGRRAREAWVRVDDELVSDVRAEDVFGDVREDRCAYLLFYARA